MTFEQFVERAKRVAVMQGREFTQPDDDWSMTVLVEHNHEHVTAIRIPGWVSNDGDAKRTLGWALGRAAQATKPTKVALIQSTWMVEPYDEDPTRPRVMPKDHPDRVERLFILVCDPEVQHAHYADIHRRRRRPPVLGPWDSIKGGQAGGQLAEPLIEAMR